MHHSTIRTPAHEAIHGGRGGSRKTALRAAGPAPLTLVFVLLLLLLPPEPRRAAGGDGPAKRKKGKRRKKRRRAGSANARRMVGTALSVLMAAQVMACAASITATAQTATTEKIAPGPLWMTGAQRRAENA